MQCERLLVAVLLLSSVSLARPAAALREKAGVLSPTARQQTILQYVAGRTDLNAAEKGTWDKTLREVFGGKAANNGEDEGVTVAKSVISAAIFFQIEPKQAARAAYQAYHDTAKWIPPPIAIDYQILTFLGRKPTVRSWDLAYDFPRHFNEEMAPDIVAWWEEMLTANKIPKHELKQVQEALARTKEKMRPMLLDLLKEGAELEQQLGRLQADPKARRIDREALAESLDGLKQELAESFRDVAHSGVVLDPNASMWDRYAAFSAEMGTKPQVREPRPQPPPAKGKKTESATGSGQKAELVPAPLPGEPLVPLPPGWSQALTRAVDGWVGVPYKWGGTTKAGVDCSGFVQAAVRDGLTIAVPRSSRTQANHGVPVPQSQLKKGDLLFFDTLDRGHITHVGIYMGDGQMAHAGCTKGVDYAPLAKSYHQKAYRAARRITAQ